MLSGMNGLQLQQRLLLPGVHTSNAGIGQGSEFHHAPAYQGAMSRHRRYPTET
jgi:hypothetical protein